MRVITQRPVVYSNVDGVPPTTAPIQNVAPATNQDTTAPSGPISLIANALSPTSIMLNWSIATDNVKVTGYDLYRNNVFVSTLLGNSFKDVGLKANTTYNYKVIAKDAAGNKSSGATVSVKTLATPSSPKPPAVKGKPIKGKGGATSEKPSATTEETKTGFWAGLSITQKGLVVVGGAILAYYGYKKFVKKGK